MDQKAEAIIAALDLAPHPEGGWYRETWRAAAAADGSGGERAAGTAIHFLLAAGERSHWHRVDAAEIWLWHGGDPLTQRMAGSEAGPVETVLLGGDVEAGQVPQLVVPAGHWQAAEPLTGEAGYTLVSCVVVPGFEFSGFTLAEPDWEPGRS
jgi:hypothetical protein